MKFGAYVKIILTIIAVCLTWICVRDMNITPSALAEAQVQTVEIKAYQLGWNQRTNVGTVQLQRADNNQLINVQN